MLNSLFTYPVPLLEPAEISWKLGEKPEAKTIKVTLSKGQKLLGVRAIGASDKFHVVVDTNTSSITVWPDSTKQKSYGAFSFSTEPALNNRVQTTVRAAVN